MPPSHLFQGFDHYYATLSHELSHWTGHSSRLTATLRTGLGRPPMLPRNSSPYLDSLHRA